MPEMEMVRHNVRPTTGRKSKDFRTRVAFRHKTYAKFFVRKSPFTPTDSTSEIQTGYPETEHSDLKIQNERLRSEVQQLRAMLSKIAPSKDNSSAGSTAPVCGLVDNRTAAAEMLASLDESESDVVLSVLSSEGKSLSEVLTQADVSRVFHVTSMLANCRAAFVHDDSIVPTEFGRLLFKWIVDLTDN